MGAHSGPVETCFDCEALEVVSYVDEAVLGSVRVQEDIAHNLYDLGRDKRTRATPWESVGPAGRQRWMDMAATAMVTIAHHENLLELVR